MKTAQALALAGHTVEFIPKSNKKNETTPDALVDGARWEFKAPRSGKISAVQDNLRKGLHQSTRIVFDSQRMKLPDHAIERELRKWSTELKSLAGLVFVNRHGQVIAIL